MSLYTLGTLAVWALFALSIAGLNRAAARIEPPERRRPHEIANAARRAHGRPPHLH